MCAKFVTNLIWFMWEDGTFIHLWEADQFRHVALLLLLLLRQVWSGNTETARHTGLE